jgi:hypothetical protein
VRGCWIRPPVKWKKVKSKKSFIRISLFFLYILTTTEMMKRGGNVCCNICKTGEINQANTGNSREGEEKLNESKR